MHISVAVSLVSSDGNAVYYVPGDTFGFMDDVMFAHEPNGTNKPKNYRPKNNIRFGIRPQFSAEVSAEAGGEVCRLRLHLVLLKCVFTE